MKLLNTHTVHKKKLSLAVIIAGVILVAPELNAQVGQTSGSDDFIMTPDMLKQKTKDIPPTPKPTADPEEEAQKNPPQPPTSTEQDAATAGADTDKTQPKEPASDKDASSTETATDETKPKEPASNKKDEPKSETQPQEAVKATESEGTKPENQETGKAADETASKTSEEQKNEGLPLLSTEPSNPRKDVVIKADKDILASVNWEGSLMFNNNNLKVVMVARQIYLKNYKGGDGANASDNNLKLSDQEMASARTGPTEIKTPLITLDSIAFFDPNHWSIWANGKKYSVGEMPDNVEIKSVSVDRVTFSWQSPSPNLFFPEWKNISNIQGDKRVIKRGNNTIEINEDTMQISFSLYPNQTFIGRSLDIVEGPAGNNVGYDVIPIATSEPTSNLDKILESTVPNLLAPFKPN